MFHLYLFITNAFMSYTKRSNYKFVSFIAHSICLGFGYADALYLACQGLTALLEVFLHLLDILKL